jgi:hypothetical protein
MTNLKIKTFLAAVILLVATGTNAQEPSKGKEELETLRQTTIKLIELMVQSGLLTQEKAEALLQDARRAAAQATTPKTEAQEKVIRVPYVPQMVRDNIKEEIRQEVVAQAKQERWGAPGTMPEWLDRIKFYGDFRLRYQYNQLDEGNAPYLNVQDTNSGGGLVLLNTTENNDLWRIRLRLGMDAKVADWATVGLRLTTGSNANPVSANQTLGNTFNRNNFALDRAYLKLDPASWITINGGRIPNPWFYTDLVWDDDLNFEGAAVALRHDLVAGTRGFATLGAFPLENADCTNATQIPNCKRDKWLYGAQVGAEQLFAGGNRVKLGLALYEFKNIAGVLNDPTIDPANRGAIPKFVQKGNTVFDIRTDGGNSLLGLAADFRELNITGLVDIAEFKPYNVSLAADYVKNIGYDRDEIRARTGGLIDQEPRTKGYQARLTVSAGDLKKSGSWQVFGGYKYLQSDAVVDGFTDSNFHLGGTDAKGWLIGGSYGIARGTQLRARWFTANEIDGPPLAIDVLQVDINAEF